MCMCMFIYSQTYMSRIVVPNIRELPNIPRLLYTFKEVPIKILRRFLLDFRN